MITIDGYTDIARIGHGGLGDVYRATRSSTGGTVAIKVLRDVSDESVVWHRTRRELTALVSLAGHSNVIQLLELLELDQGPALVMEYAPGGSVAELMHRRGNTLSVGETVLVGRHTAAALVAAHEQGIVHRDVKPQNLLIDAYGQVKLCDFGVAALTRTDDFRARTNALSMRYASPEDLDDDIDVGPPADVYSLGATLLHLARGAPPTLRERLVPWTPPSTDDADAAALDDVIARCLRPDPAARPSAAEVFDELERLGWAVDERQRALAFELPVSDVGDAAAEATDPTDQRVPLDDDSELTAVRPRAPADDNPTVVRGGPSEPDAPHAHPMSPAPPRPSATSRPRWLLPALAGTAVVAVLALAFWWSTRGADDDAAATTTVPGATASGSDVIGDVGIGDVEVELVARPAGLVGVTELVWPFGDVGECLAQTDEVLIPVPCAEPHDLQRILVAELDSARFPSAAAYDAALTRGAVTEACEAAFESYTGVAFAASALETPFTMPSAESWTTGDRRYQCMVFSPGRRIIGDIAAPG